MPNKKMPIKRGDRVLVLSGKERSTREHPVISQVVEVRTRRRQVLVSDVNLHKKHVKPTQKVPQGGIVSLPSPIDVSNVMLICPHCQRPTRIRRRIAEDGVRVRVCRKCEAEIDEH